MEEWETYQKNVEMLRKPLAESMRGELEMVGFIDLEKGYFDWSALARQFSGQIGRAIKDFWNGSVEDLAAEILRPDKHNPGEFRHPDRATVRSRWMRGLNVPGPGELIQIAILSKRNIREYFRLGGTTVPWDKWSRTQLERELAPLNCALETCRAAGKDLWNELRGGTVAPLEADGWLRRKMEESLNGYRRSSSEESLLLHHVQDFEGSYPDNALLWFYHVDGWHNLAMAIPHWCVSVAVYRVDRDDIQPVCAVAFAPALDELFYAMHQGMPILETRGETQDLTVLQDASIRKSIVATHFSVSYDKVSERYLNSGFPLGLLRVCQSVEAIGCGILALCYVAAGRFGAFLNPISEPESVRAGRIILEAAGRGDPDIGLARAIPVEGSSKIGVLAAANRRVLEEMLDIGTILQAWPPEGELSGEASNAYLDGLVDPASQGISTLLSQLESNRVTPETLKLIELLYRIFGDVLKRSGR